MENPTPRPPSERGWSAIGVVANGPHASQVTFDTWPVSFKVKVGEDLNALPDTASVDRTFENETRPHQ
jgi:hypothetical protein